MSSGPGTVVDVNMCGAGAAPKVEYMNESGGAMPLCHVGTFSGALLQLSSLSIDFSLYLAMHAIDGTTGMAWGPLS